MEARDTKREKKFVHESLNACFILTTHPVDSYNTTRTARSFWPSQARASSDTRSKAAEAQRDQGCVTASFCQEN